MALERLKSEFALAKFSFNLDATHGGENLSWKEAFGHNANRCVKNYYVHLAIRLAFFLFIFCVLVTSLSMNWNGGFWFVYLTHWGLFLEFVYFSLALAVTIQSRKEEKTNGDKVESETPLLVKLMWFVWTIVLPGSFVIFCLYWAAVFKPGNVEALTILTHGANFLVVAIDAALSSAPYNLLHGVYFFIFGCIYVLCSYIFYAANVRNPITGANYVYSVLDWSKPGSALIFAALILLVMIPIIIFVFWFLILMSNKHSCHGSKDNNADKGTKSFSTTRENPANSNGSETFYSVDKDVDAESLSSQETIRSHEIAVAMV